MVKKIRSWSKPDDTKDLIGIKKVDLSVFTYGIHIPNAFREDFVEANQGKEVDSGSAQEIVLIMGDKRYTAELRNIHQNDYENGALQIRYDSKPDIKEYFIEALKTSYEYILAEQDRTKSTNIIVPDHLAEFIEFYRTDIPFQYTVKLITNSKPLFGYPFRIIFNSVEDARWTLGFIKEIFRKLDINNENDERFSIVLPNSGNAIHLSYCNWRIFGVRRENDGDTIFELALLDQDLPDIGLKHILNFKQGVKENSVSIYALQFDDVKKFENDIWNAINKIIPVVKEKFKNHKKALQVGLSVKSLSRALFDDVYLEDVLINGIDTEVKVGTWIFQADPKDYNLKGAVAGIEEIAWKVTRYKESIKQGDKVYLWEAGKDAGILAVGEIETVPAIMSEKPEEELYHVGEKKQKRESFFGVNVKIKKKLKERLTRADLKENSILKNLSIIKNAQGTNFPVANDQEMELSRIIEELDPSGLTANPPDTNPSYTIPECAEKLGMEIEIIDRWIKAIERKGQAVIYGPPGTGKTYSATEIAKVLIAEGNGFIETVQFHPAYSYEDFILGIRPVTEGNVLSYQLVDGRFIEFCERSRGIDGKCVLIIDEINRANLSRVFGELMYLLEYRKESIPLAGGRYFSIPENVYIIGTMNTADRSIAIVDHALRRRFAFLELTTNYSVLEKFHEGSNFPIKELIKLLKQINSAIGDKRYEIGISYFLRENLIEDIQDIWEMEITPYLEEYFFDQPNKASAYRWDKVEGILANG